jgi:hypothetical protein
MFNFIKNIIFYVSKKFKFEKQSKKQNDIELDELGDIIMLYYPGNYQN